MNLKEANKFAQDVMAIGKFEMLHDLVLENSDDVILVSVRKGSYVSDVNYYDAEFNAKLLSIIDTHIEELKQRNGIVDDEE